MATKNLVLRTMYIDPDVDDQLRTEAFDSRTSKNDLLRKYLRLGMEAAKPAPSPKVAAKKAAAKPAAKPAAVARNRNATPVAGKVVVGAAAGGKKAGSKPAVVG